MAEQYLIDIRTIFHPEEVDAYVQHVRQAMAAISSLPTAAAAQEQYNLDAPRISETFQRSQALGSAERQRLLRETQAELIRHQRSQFERSRVGADGALQPSGLEQARLSAYQAAGRAKSLAADEEYTQATVRAAEATALLSARRALALAADNEYIQATIAASTAQAQHAARVSQLQAGNRAYLEATQLATIRQTEAATSRSAVLTADPALLQTKIAADIARRSQTEQERLAIAQSTMANERGSFESAVRERVLKAQRERAEKELNAALNERVRIELQQNIAQATLTQRLLARLRGGDPVDQPRFGSFLGTSFARTASFAVSAGVVYGAVAGIREMIKNAQELERTFSLIRAQLNQLGEGDQFAGFRDRIFEISRESGLASKDVAFLAFQLRGAFGNNELALQNAESAAQLVRITGLSLTEVTDSLTAAARSFGNSFGEIGDLALAMQERTGVLAEQSIKAVADLSPVANQVGLDARETFALVSTAQQFSGRSGEAIAEGLGRILPAMQQSSVAVVQLYNQLPVLSENLNEVAKATAEGRFGDVLLRLTRDYGHLTAAQQANVLSLLGGRREAQVLVPILQNYRQVVTLLDDDLGEAGKTQDYFNKLQETLSQRVARVAEQFRQFGQALFEAGIGEILKDLAAAGLVALEFVSMFARALATVNEATGGWLPRILLLTVGIRGLAAALRLVRDASIVRGVTSAVGGVASQAIGPLATARSAYLTARVQPIGGPIELGVPAVTTATRLTAARTAALSALGGVAGITTLAVGAVALAYSQARSDQQNKMRETAGRIRKLDEAALQRVASDRASFLETLTAGLTGTRTEDILAQEEQGRRRAKQPDAVATRERFRAAVRARLIGELSPDETKRSVFDNFNQEERLKLQEDYFGIGPQIKFDANAVRKIRSDAAKGVELALRLETALVNAVLGDPERAQRFQRSLDNLKNINTPGLAREAQQTGELVQGIEEARSQYEAGEISATDYLAALRQAANAYELIASSSQGPLDPEVAKEQADLIKRMNQFLAERRRNALDFARELRAISGQDTPEARIQDLLRFLNDPDVKDPEARLKAARDIADAQRDILETQIKAAEDAGDIAGAQRIAQQGIKLDPAVVNALRAQAIANNDEWQNLITQLRGLGVSTAEIIRLIQAGMVGAARSAAEANVRFWEDIVASSDVHDREANKTRLQQAKAALEEFDRTNRSAPTKVPDKVVASPEEQARLERERIAKEIKDRETLEEAQLELERARAEGDKQALARIDIKAADQAAARAANIKDAAERKAAILRAQAARVQAERSLDEAIFSMMEAQFELAIAVAGAADDTVAVARIELDRALTVLGRAQRTQDPEDDVRAQAAVVNAQANVVREQIRSEEENIDLQLTLGRISIGQAVARLRLLQATATTRKQIDEIEVKIRQLLESAGQDLQFNLPQLLQLPTLYESRRATQGYGQGIGYQDNRSQTIQIYNSGSAEQNAAAQRQFEETLNAPPRNGFYARNY